ncbi:MAG TPA: HNH endonuclease [Candidatus Acidoferrales bacterium]|nr:HNH endonuclease [Candidatus Acidoferrales bacterium]
MATSRFAIANITWNNSGWKNTYVNPKAGHSYAKSYPGHESLNFKFDKKNLDDSNKVYGYVHWTFAPTRLDKKAVVFFYTKNLTDSTNQIVGVYGNAEVIDPAKETVWAGFKENKLFSNLVADKELSLLFPVPLNAYKYSGGKRLVPQVGFTYVEIDLARQIIEDEIREATLSGITNDQFNKFARIFEFITGMPYAETYPASRAIAEQNELEKEIRKDLTDEKKQALIDELNSLTPALPRQVVVNGKTYERDNKTIASLKVLRDKCQMCGKFVLKKNGGHYVEAAHIKSKSSGGPETPDNLLILCPNHHKEFDLGDRNIIVNSKEKIIFDLNGNRYDIDLSL